MPHQNRVTPFSELVVDSARGLVYGNRGCLHDRHGVIRRRYGVRRWISCRLEFRGWRRGAFLQPGKFTELFFLDEATAFATERVLALVDELGLEAAGSDVADALRAAVERGGGLSIEECVGLMVDREWTERDNRRTGRRAGVYYESILVAVAR